MSTPDPAEPIAQERRKEVFRAVVEAQDGGAAVAASRAEVARRFGITEAQVRAIEQEGMANQWPPL